MASQTEPSAISESPINTHVRPGRPSSLMDSDMPRPTASPWPSEPLATSIQGSSATGAG